MVRSRAHFSEVRAAAARMAGCGAEWFVVGGWAIDLFLGRQTREHDDVDLGLFREDQGLLREHLFGGSFDKVVPGVGRVPWGSAKSDWLELPVHELHACSTTGQSLEFLLQERDGGDWVFRRDPRIRLPVEKLALTDESGLSFMAAEVVLLYKAKGPRDRDRADLDLVLPRLTDAARSWLASAIDLWEAGHPWLPRLRYGSAS